MFSYIKGKLIQISTEYIVVENNGIGYMIHIPYNVNVPMPTEGEEVLIYTHFNVSESGIALYGFFNEEDKKMFNSIKKVSGVGPKVALSILSTLTAKDFIFAILNDDAKAISKAPGVGAKIAKRIILDLKDKLDITEEDLLDIPVNSINTGVSMTGAINDAIAALSALGYPYQDSKRAVMSVENAEDLDVENLLRLALKEI